MNKFTEWLSDILRSIRYFFRMKVQKLLWGFNDYEVVDLDNIIAEFMLPRLKRFRDYTLRRREEIFGKDEKLNEAIEKMIFSFDYKLRNLNSVRFGTPEEVAKYVDGLRAFIDYYDHLWD